MKRWKINEYNSAAVSDLSRRCDLTPLTLKVLSSRGFNDLDQIASLLRSDEFADPFTITDMRKAAETIEQAVDAYELICIYGDYDCDGVTATTILYSYLQNIGANVMYYIPERADGYGMSITAVEKLAEQGVRLIVTVDNGISAINEAEKIYELGMKLVVTDHHQPGEKLPRAEAVVDPHRADCTSEYKDLCGAGIALKLCIALNDGEAETVIEQFSDICAIGTVADVVPLTGENRKIVKTGLAYLKNTENFGLDQLMTKASVNRESLSSTTIAFQIAPRINASGRFGSPLTAVKALLAEDEDEAETYVDTLVTLNEERRSTENDILKAILHYIDNNPHVLNQRVLILAGNAWHHGVIGIVAAKLLEQFGKPTILLSIEDNGFARGSARSIKGFNIFECLTYASDLLDHYGGHECAGGLTVSKDKIGELTKRIYKFAERFDMMPTLSVDSDFTLEPADLTVENVKGLSVLEPFGAGNSRPVFAMIDAAVEKVEPLSGGKHSRLQLNYRGTQYYAPIFNVSPSVLGINQGDRLDLAVNLEINEYGGKQSINLRIVDQRPHGINQDRYFNARDCYERFSLGAELPLAFLKKIDPSREELVLVYKKLSAEKEMDIDGLYMSLRSATMNYCKLRIILDAFVQTGLSVLSASANSVKLLPVTQKVDLDSADVLTRLRSKINKEE
ncbi:single-stranded-DNA-specific exonuclease [Ruminococcaceae bacterium FB2012]|nr:single-stranded-DNA-specific exonuclease [Ruminococcaceae bacterium FB2012]